MAIKSDAQRKAVAKWNAENYDQIQLRVPKGMKAVISEYVKEHGGKSVNEFINNAISEAMKKEQAEQRS